MDKSWPEDVKIECIEENVVHNPCANVMIYPSFYPSSFTRPACLPSHQHTVMSLLHDTTSQKGTWPRSVFVDVGGRSVIG